MVSLPQTCCPTGMPPTVGAHSALPVAAEHWTLHWAQLLIAMRRVGAAKLRTSPVRVVCVPSLHSRMESGENGERKFKQVHVCGQAAQAVQGRFWRRRQLGSLQARLVKGQLECSLLSASCGNEQPAFNLGGPCVPGSPQALGRPLQHALTSCWS